MASSLTFSLLIVAGVATITLLLPQFGSAKPTKTDICNMARSAYTVVKPVAAAPCASFRQYTQNYPYMDYDIFYGYFSNIYTEDIPVVWWNKIMKGLHTINTQGLLKNASRFLTEIGQTYNAEVKSFENLPYATLAVTAITAEQRLTNLLSYDPNFCLSGMSIIEPVNFPPPRTAETKDDEYVNQLRMYLKGTTSLLCKTFDRLTNVLAVEVSAKCM